MKKGDESPVWKHKKISDVTEKEVDQFFIENNYKELKLKPTTTTPLDTPLFKVLQKKTTSLPLTISVEQQYNSLLEESRVLLEQENSYYESSEVEEGHEETNQEEAIATSEETVDNNEELVDNNEEHVDNNEELVDNNEEHLDNNEELVEEEDNSYNYSSKIIKDNEEQEEQTEEEAPSENSVFNEQSYQMAISDENTIEQFSQMSDKTKENLITSLRVQKLLKKPMKTQRDMEFIRQNIDKISINKNSNLIKQARVGFIEESYKSDKLLLTGKHNTLVYNPDIEVDEIVDEEEPQIQILREFQQQEQQEQQEKQEQQEQQLEEESEEGTEEIEDTVSTDIKELRELMQKLKQDYVAEGGAIEDLDAIEKEYGLNDKEEMVEEEEEEEVTNLDNVESTQEEMIKLNSQEEMTEEKMTEENLINEELAEEENNVEDHNETEELVEEEIGSEFFSNRSDRVERERPINLSGGLIRRKKLDPKDLY